MTASTTTYLWSIVFAPPSTVEQNYGVAPSMQFPGFACNSDAPKRRQVMASSVEEAVSLAKVFAQSEGLMIVSVELAGVGL